MKPPSTYIQNGWPVERSYIVIPAVAGDDVEPTVIEAALTLATFAVVAFKTSAFTVLTMTICALKESAMTEPKRAAASVIVTPRDESQLDTVVVADSPPVAVSIPSADMVDVAVVVPNP